MEMLDIQGQTFILRIITALIICFGGWELWKSSRLLENNRVTVFVRNVVAVLVGFGILRLAASFIDDRVESGIGWTSNIVNIGFWLLVWWRFYTIRKAVEIPMVSPDKAEMVEAVDRLLATVEKSREKLNALKNL